MENSVDIIIAGTGVAGLFCALNLPEDKRVLMITKNAIEDSDSFLAQGGICVLKSEDDYDSYFEDTMRAGHYENNKDSVEVMIRTSPEIIKDLVGYGVEFEKENGKFVYTKEGAHSTERILYHQDITGQELTSKVLDEVKKRNNIIIQEHTTLLDVIRRDNTCAGVVARDGSGLVAEVLADYVVLATGGIGGLYEYSTNFPHITGDSIAIAIKNNIELLHEDYIQIHPTTLYSGKSGRSFLISESVRGEGAYLYNAKGKRFVDELLPRDVLTQAIQEQMKKDKKNFVWLSMKKMGEEKIKKRFPNIYKKCLEEGYDITREWIPVTPAQHYYMGGIKVDLNGRTSMEHLYAIGETSCNGVHGANRLASNSLLESLVFAKRSALDLLKDYEETPVKEGEVDLSSYSDGEKLKRMYKQIVLDRIERKKQHDKFSYYESKCR